MTRTPWLRLLPLTLPMLLTAPGKSLAAEPPGASWVRQLGSDAFAEREAAAAALERMGAAALPALQQAAGWDDAEVRRRAGELERRLRRRLDSAAYLEPKKVRVTVRDLPVRAAAAEFQRQTGFVLAVEDAAGNLDNRRLTLDTGWTTFWEALDQFCRAAGLTEAHLLSPDRLADLPRHGFRAPMTAELLDPFARFPSPGGAAPLRLVAGEPLPLATCLVGGLRIRMLPRHVPTTHVSHGDGVCPLTLEVRPEPGLTWPGVSDVLVHHTVDDCGQRLVQVPTNGTPRPELTEVWGAVRVWDASNVWTDGPADPNHVTVALQRGSKSAARLRELHGVLTATVRTPPQALLAIDRPGESVGRVVTGAYGGSLRVTDFRRDDAGRVLLKVELVKPEQAVGDPPPAETPPILAVPRAGVLRVWPEPVEKPNSGELRLLDERGRAFPLGVPPAATATGQECHLTFAPRPGLGQPVRLEFVARRALVVEVPFTLRDVPLR